MGQQVIYDISILKIKIKLIQTSLMHISAFFLYKLDK